MTPPTTPAALTAPALTRPLAGRLASLLYGATVYALFLATFLYLVGWVAGAFVPKHVDGGAAGVPAASTLEALLVNGAFLGLFALQHAVMARRGFKERWTRVVPPQVERSTFVLATCAVLIGMVWNWRALPQVVWHVDGAGAVALWTLSGLGWGIVLLSTFLIDHFELFGLRQVVRHFRGLDAEPPKFRERWIYRFVRHPLMLGFLIAFWSTPHMTVGHLFFAATVTVYILIALQIEERDLVTAHGDAYRDYRRRVPMLVPLPRRAA